MSHAAAVSLEHTTDRGPSRTRPIPPFVLGWSLSLSFVISYVLCVIGYYALPSLPILHEALAIPLPGFRFDSWPRFCLGLAESFAWGWYIAFVFAPLYNLFARRSA